MIRHFGYGSNVSYLKMWSDLRRVMFDGTGTSTSLEPCYQDVDEGVLARLNGYKIAVAPSGASTIQESEDNHVIGVLYELSEDQMHRLRVSEGKDDLGIMVDVQIFGSNTTETAYTWVWSHAEDESTKVRKYYFELIAEALRMRGIDDFDPEYLDEQIVPILLKRYRLKSK